MCLLVRCVYDVCGLLWLMWCAAVVGRCRGFLMIFVGFVFACVLRADSVFFVVCCRLFVGRCMRCVLFGCILVCMRVIRLVHCVLLFLPLVVSLLSL